MANRSSVAVGEITTIRFGVVGMVMVPFAAVTETAWSVVAVVVCEESDWPQPASAMTPSTTAAPRARTGLNKTSMVAGKRETRQDGSPFPRGPISSARAKATWLGPRGHDSCGTAAGLPPALRFAVRSVTIPNQHMSPEYDLFNTAN